MKTITELLTVIWLAIWFVPVWIAFFLFLLMIFVSCGPKTAGRVWDNALN